MNTCELQFAAITHVIYSTLLRMAPDDSMDPDRDRGAVSIEQVLWYAAAAVSVAVVAGIVWRQVSSTADDVSPVVPAAP